MKRYSFDIDGTVCQNTFGKYNLCKPYRNRIKLINNLYTSGNYIIYFTARGMGSCEGNQKLAYEKYYQYTFDQLKNWGCEFHELYLGKPNADIYIDDKAILDSEFFPIDESD